VPTPAEVRARALASLIPPARLPLSAWIEAHIRLPQGTTAVPGPMKLWPYQRAIADSVADPEVERVTLVKPVRVGFTSLLTAATGHFVANEPSPILCLLPTEADCRDYMVSDLEPTFAASPALRGLLSREVEHGEDRSTILHRLFAGGSLKIVASKSPRNLRRHTAKVLFIDEADAMEVTTEGSPIMLGEKRTLSFADRKIVVGSTPLHEETSAVLRSYGESDARIYECPCPSCGGFTEVMWQHIEWEPERPETAAFRCPHCEALVEERHKLAMVEAGAWRATRPEVSGHHGYRLNALVSLLANASWAKLAAEFLRAKGDPATLQPFVNTVLAQGWRAAESDIDESALAARAEAFGLDNVPAEVLIVTAGTDIQVDRIETTLTGWTRTGECLVLEHITHWGPPDQDQVWRDLDDLLKTRWPHRFGGTIGIDAAVIDSGFATDAVYRFAFPRAGRRVMAGKGMPGARPIIAASKSRISTKTGLAGRLWIVGIDQIKTTLFAKLARGRSIRFSESLEASFYEQLASERIVTRYSRGQPVRMFERIPGKRAEALDALTYATAARAGLGTVNFDQREAALRQTTVAAPPPQRPRVIRSYWLDRQ
jgi:phage terminase large subunit GpA-like protein